ncbi:chaperone modulator CbpM [Lentzea aerocolonigenes]|uniref:chaperone modulator CbpM n=1 Tax=Lentzea aerocolonigenes TaxID=68170 RepID=UPI0004C3E4DC|nr:chaperone modulator CbpM [Lentzea aerocolonigenes]MCP2242409.1 MerR HTH family regulatory protein [Lentzea aerocolonigenes]
MYPLTKPVRLSTNRVSAHTGLHPELVRRFAALGLIECAADETGRLWFPPETVARIARIQRLRSGLSLNYTSVGLVLDLLDRIRVLEAQARGSDRRWT